MGLTGLRLRSLVYHGRGNLAVLLGVAVGTAVLTGALLVGDSLTGSLRDLTLRRLGWVDQALVGPKFFRAAVADGLPADRVAPAILLRATAEKEKDPSNSAPVRDGPRSVTLLGVDERFGITDPPPGFWSADSDPDAVLLSPNVMGELGVHAGDVVVFRVQRATEVPRESLLGKRADPVEALRFRVAGSLGNQLAAHFSLNPAPEAPRNAVVALAALQRLLEQPGRANALLVGDPRPGLTEAFQARLTLDDWGLRLTTPRQRADALFARYAGDREPDPFPRPLPLSRWYKGIRNGRPQATFATTYAWGAWGIFDPESRTRAMPRQPLPREKLQAFFEERHPYLSLESRQLILGPEVSSAARQAAQDAGLEAAPTLVYLTKLEARGAVVAGIVAALPPALPPPLGPFLPPGVTALADDQIVVVALPWKQEPILPDLKPGSEVTLRFKPPEHQPGLQPDRTATFHVAGTLPLTGVADDPDLTPAFPGITDQDDPRSWKLPFEDPNDPQWLTDRIRQEFGELFWSEYRTTPKAYITLAAGQKLWGSRFGDLTSVRLAPRPGESPEAARDRYAVALLRHLDPQAAGLAFLPVKVDALKASAGSTNFASLFLGFSFFLIAAALLLVALLFRLNLDRRAGEVGLLLAVGYRRRAVWWLLLGEGTLLAVVGVLVGLGAALAYTVLLVRFLAAVWPGGALRSFLEPHFEDSSTSLAIGAAGSLVVSVLSIAWALFGLGRVPPAALLKGKTTTEGQAGAPTGGSWSWIIAAVALLLAPAVMSLAVFVPGSEARAGSFFSSGALLLTAALAALSGWLRGARHQTVEGGGWWAVTRLGVRNAARNPGRSLLTAGLLASVAFILVAVESFRRHADAESGPHAPDGGFALLAESDLPIVDPEGVLQTRFADADEATRALLKGTKILSFRVQAGDDASCLNLFQPKRPRILGVPGTLIERGGFRFAALPAGANPWEALDRPGQDVPAFGENNTVLWQLKTDVGGTLEVPDGRGTAQTLQIVGLLQDSVFQNGLLISEERFKQLYPGVEGYQFFLVQPPPGQEKAVQELLKQAFTDRGLQVTPSAQRLDAYLAVENTYLTTLQALGGLGLILGSLGLAVVLLRGVWERRGELALLRALGWRRATLGWLILAENGFLLLVGLGAGTLAAVLSVLPQLATGGGALPWRELLILFGVVLLVGLGAGTAAVWSTLRAPLVQALRRE